MIQFIKIRTKKEAMGGAKTLLLELTKQTDEFYIGFEVDQEGNPKHCSQELETIHFISKQAVKWVKPQKWNLKYGTLENQ